MAVGAGDSLGESPVWDPRDGCLYWVDIRRQLVQRWQPASNTYRNWTLAEDVGSLCLRDSGGLLLALRSGLAIFDTTDGTSTLVTQPHAGQPEMRFNDGRCDRTGAFWAGSMNDRTHAPVGRLYRFGPQRRLEEKLTGIRVPNSLCWSPDGGTMYFSDSPGRVIWAFAADGSGDIGARRVFTAIEAPGVPDGATVDCEGFVWCALYGGWSVARFAPDGRTDLIVHLPVQQPTSCAFGGANLDTLFVTTATQHLEPDALQRQPLAGSVLCFDPGVRGCVEPRFAG